MPNSESPKTVNFTQHVSFMAIFVLSILCQSLSAAEIDDALRQLRETCGGESCRATAERDMDWRIVSLDIGGTGSTFPDADFERISTLTDLVHLGLANDIRVSEHGWTRLGSLRRLTSLWLGPKAFGEGAAIEFIAPGLFHELKEIRMPLLGSLSLHKILSQLPRLETIVYFESQNGKKLSAIEIKAVEAQWAGFLRLQRLVLADRAFGDEQAKALVSLNTLQDLDLVGSSIGDSSIPGLAGLVNLRSIRLNSINQSGVDAIQHLPHLERLQIVGCSAESLDLSRLNSVRSVTLATDEFSVAWRLQLQLPPNLKTLCMPAWIKGDGGAAKDVFHHPLPPSIESVRLRLFQGCPTTCVTPREIAQRKPSELTWLKELPNLKEIELIDPLTEDFESICGLTSLRRLVVTGSRATLGTGAIEKSNSLQGLDSLKISFQFRMTDAALGVIGKMKGLRELAVNPVPTEIRRLWAISSLEKLNLWVPEVIAGTAIENRMFRGIESLSELKELTLSGMVTDADLKDLATLRKLQRFDLRGCQGFTDAGLGALVKALPELKTLVWSVSREKKP